MNHPEPEKWMSYLYGELGEPEQKDLTGHLEGCSDCQAQVKSWQATMIQLDRWKVPSITHSRGAYRTWFKVVRWSAAAVIVLTAGVLAGWVGASKSVDPEALRQDLETSLTVSLKPIIEEDLRQKLSQEMVVVLANYRAQVSEALYQQIQLQLKEYAFQTLTVSGAQTNQLLGQLVALAKEAYLEDRQIYGSILKQLEDKRIREQEQLRNEFALFAQETGGRLLETQKSIAQLITEGQKGNPQTQEPNPEPK